MAEVEGLGLTGERGQGTLVVGVSELADGSVYTDYLGVLAVKVFVAVEGDGPAGRQGQPDRV